MVEIVFIENDGTERKIKARSGETVMLAAAKNGVPGIDADCGGSCSCATCHVFVHVDWLVRVGEMNPTEEAMLSLNPYRRENSRLSCQITINEELNGLVVSTPEFQF